MPFDMTCNREEEEKKKKRLGKKEKKKKRKLSGMKDLQCNNQAPGLSATTRRVIDCPAGIWTTSLRIGFACPSTTGRSRSGSEKFNDRATMIDLCPCKWLIFENKKKD